MSGLAEILLAEIEAGADEWVSLLQEFVRRPTPNPPGDTRAGTAHLARFLAARGLEHRLIAPLPEAPNLVAQFDAARPGRHLVLNGHIDVFPAGDAGRWKHDPWSGAIEDGRLYGRGVADMKCGTTSSVITYALLHRHRDRLAGRLSLTCVSDEETGGRWGAGYLFAHHPEYVLGDCCLNGEPSSAHTVRWGEKLPLWLAFTVKTRGAHGAYIHMSESASLIALDLMERLEAVTRLQPDPAPEIARNLSDPEVRAALDRSMGKGAADLLGKVSLNIGVVEGGLKTNMIPSECRVEADIRIPFGLSKAEVLACVHEILRDFPQVSVAEESVESETHANWCDPDGEMLRIIQGNALKVRGIKPVPIATLALTDTRWWRNAGIPAYIYGCAPDGMASHDESVSLEEFLHVLRVHALSAAAYLGGE
ncbi:MAG: M20/M25/M40 family metallo-hydrolase [Reyranella sp.]